MGIVYLAHDEHLDRDVAVKVLTPDAPSGDRRGRFQKEALALSRLNHPNVAIIHDFETVEGLDLLVMEFIPGAGLDTMARDGPLPEEAVLALGIQVAEGLAAAHAHGIVHGDLKPANVRVTPDGRAKILDFGLARRMPAPDAQTRTATRDGMPGGTLAYMAPELLAGSPPAAGSDIYAFGVLLYELAAGRRPFAAPSDPLLIDAILHQRPSPIGGRAPGVSAELNRIVLKALDRAPERRYQTAREMLVDMQRLQQGGDRVSPQPPFRISRRAALVGSAGGSIGLIGAALLWKSRSPAAPAGFSARDWVLVAEFDNYTDEAHIDGTVRRALLIALQQSSYVNVLPDARVAEALARMKRRDRPRITGDVAAEICRRENVRVLLTGAVQQSGRTLQIGIRALNPADLSLLFAERADLQRRELLFSRVDELATRVRQRLGESLSVIRTAAEPLARVTTASFQALEQYSLAAEAMNRGAVDQAVALLDGALTLDPQFAMAHDLVADGYLTLGDRQRQLQHLERAYALREDVTLRERYTIEARYFGVHERYDEQADRLRALTAIYPDDAAARQHLAQALSNVMDLPGAIAEAREGVRLRGNAVEAYEQLLLLLTTAGRNEEALRIGDTVARTLGATPRLDWAAGMAHFGLDRLAEAHRIFEGLAATDGPYASIGRLYLVRLDLYRGRFGAAETSLAEDILADARQGYTAAELTRRYLRGRVRLAVGDGEGAAKEADAIAAFSDDVLQAGDLLRAAILHARSGRAARARAAMGRAEAFARRAPSSFTRGISDGVAGEVALAEGDFARAEQAFLRAFRQYPVHLAQQGLAESLRRQQKWPAAAGVWERVLASRGEILRNGFAADWVLAHLGAAECYRRAGDPVKARDHVARAAAAWADADRAGPGALLAGAQAAVNRAAHDTESSDSPGETGGRR
jgi:tetratricopeptide (TPR) repeat protein